MFSAIPCYKFCSIPYTTTQQILAELFLKRPIRTRLDLLRPNLEDKVTQKQESQKRFLDNAGHKTREFILGQDVLVENLRSNIPKWITGKILAKTGPLSYRIEIDGIIHRRHVDQMLPSKTEVVVTDKNQRRTHLSQHLFITTLQLLNQ